MNTVKKINQINLLRVFLVIMIAMFHMYHDLQCDFGFLNPMLEEASFFMTQFFMLSGFVLFYNYQNEEFDNIDSIFKFLKKRIVRLFPMYLLVYILFFIFFNTQTLEQDISTFVHQIFLVQYTIGYKYLMNSEMWFLSCIFICYLIFPYISQLIKWMSHKNIVVFAAIIIILNAFAPFIEENFGVSIYGNAFFRLGEFIVGAIFARIYMESKRKSYNDKLIVVLVIATIAFLYGIQIFVPSMSGLKNQAKTSAFAILLTGPLLVSLSLSENKFIKFISSNKFTNMLTSISLEIFIGSIVAEKIINKFIYPRIQPLGNVKKLLLCVVFYLLCAITLKLFNEFMVRLIKQNKKVAKYGIIIVLIIFYILFIMKAYNIYRPESRYDFTNSDIEIQHKPIKGVFGDDGLYTWCEKESKYKLRMKDATKLKINIATLLQSRELHVEVQVNNQVVGNVLATNAECIYEFDLPAGDTSSDVTVKLICDNTFKPSEEGINANDVRDLGIQLYYIGLE